jgi:hypothetical protein
MPGPADELLGLLLRYPVPRVRDDPAGDVVGEASE